MADPAGIVTIRYFAAARAAAGVTEEQVELPAQATLADVLAGLAERHGQRLTSVLTRCSFLLDAVAVHGTAARVPPGSVVDVLPPFAGG